MLTLLGNWEVTLDADGDHGWDQDGNEFHILRSLPDPSLVASPDAQGAVPQRLTFDETFSLHSRPTAAHTIYLDFDGHVTSGTSWRSGGTFTTPEYDRDGNPASFSQSELDDIFEVWERVVEDFAPFDVDVTTEEPPLEDLMRSGPGDDAWGIRVAIGGHFNDWLGASAGGVAFIGSFNSTIDTPTYVFSDVLFSPKSVAEATSHEVGHTLGLGHDGDATRSYYSGHGSGPTGWAPIMGVGYSRQLVQWSRGEYAGANNQQDDLLIITSNNGFGYRADLAGDTSGEAASLTLDGTSVDQAGVIETTADIDVYSFKTGDGPVSFDIQPWHRSPNLDIEASLVDSMGNVLATSNPIGQLDAQISMTLQEGEYFLHLEGVGEGDPLGSGYSDYGSIGQFTITGSITEPSNIDVEVVGGNLVLTDTFDRGSDLQVRIEGGTVFVTSQATALDAQTGVTQVSATQVTVPLVDVTGSLLMNLAGGDDNVELQTPEGFVSLPINFAAGDGVDSFTVATAAGFGTLDAATYTRSGLSSGQVTYTTADPSPVIDYSGLERLIDQTDATTRDVNVTGGGTALQADSGADPTDGVIAVISAGGTALEFSAPSAALLISTDQDANANSVTLGGFGSELTGVLDVIGGANDALNVAGAFDPGANPLSLVSGTMSVNAPVGTNSTSGNVLLTANDLTISAFITSAGDLQIQPLTPMTTIGIGDAATGDLTLNDLEIARLSTILQEIQIGDPVAADGSVEITSGSFQAPLLVTGTDIAVTGLTTFSNSLELVALTGDITSLTDPMAASFDVAGGTVTLRTLGDATGEIGTTAAPLYVSTDDLVTDSAASLGDQFLATLSTATVTSAAGGVFNIEDGTFNAGTPGALSGAAGLTIGDSGMGHLDLNGNSVDVAFVSGAIAGGTITLGDQTLTVDGDQTATFAGGITGTGSLIKSGSGTQTLAGTNFYTGVTVVSDGTLLVDGGLSGSVSLTGGVLGGSGTVAGDVSGTSSGGGISPGSSPGQLTVSGNVTLDSSQTFSVEIEGLTPGTQHDQLILDGTSAVLTLSGSQLVASINGYVPTPGDEITIVDLIDPASTTVGNFQDLPEGTAIEIDGFAFTISYAGGTDSNDVVLTAIPSAVRVVAQQESVAEDSGSLGFQFERFGGTSSDVTVNFSVTGLADSSDFVLTGATSYDPGTGTGTATLLSGEQTFGILITPNADSEFELDEDVVVTVDPGSGYEPGATVTDSAVIENDDVGIAVSIDQPSVFEPDSGALVYTFTRHEDITGTLLVNFEVDATSTADLDVDFLLSGMTTLSGTMGTVVFSDGQDTFDITVTPVDDDLFELPETVTISVLPGTGYDPTEPLQASSATGLIVNEDNAIPTLNEVHPVFATEDDPLQRVALGGITGGFSDQQNLRVTAVSSRPEIVPTPTVVYASPQTTAELQFTPVTDSWGPLTFTVTVEDGGLDNDLATTADNLTFSREIEVLVRPVNDNPTLDPISDQMVNEDTGEHAVPLAGLSPGPKEFEPFRISAVSSDSTLIPFITIDHAPQAPMGTLRYRTGRELSGTATITVTVTDAGADGTLTTSADNLTIVRTFDVTVDPVNDPPTIDALPAVVINEDTPMFDIALTGISGGPGESQSVQLATRTLNTDGNPDQSLIPDPAIFDFPVSGTSSTARLQLNPVPNAFGNAIVELTLTDPGPDLMPGTIDDGVRVERFSVAVRPENDPPQSMNQTFMVAEASPADTLVGTIMATDIDLDRLRYEIVAGNTNDAFKIDTNTGDLLVNDQGALDLETIPTFDLTVVVTDLGNPPEAVSIQVTVDLIDVDPEGELTIDPADWQGSDSLTVRRSGAMFENLEIVNGDGVQIALQPVAGIDQLIINGSDGVAETVLVDFSVANAFGNGDAVPPLGLVFNGGSGDVADELSVRARLSDVFDTVTHTLTGADSAQIRANDNLLLLNGVERITDTLRAAHRNVNLQDNDDHITLQAGSSAGDFLIELQSMGTTPFVTFGAPVSGVTVDLSDGNDTFTVESFELGLRDRLTVRGGAGDDAFLIGGLNGDTVTIEGGAGTDTLFEVVGSDVRIQNDRIEELSGSLPRILAVLSDVDVVHVTGTDDADQLDATGFAGTVALSGLAGNDVLIGGLGDDTLDGGDNRDRLIGGPGNDQLFGGMHGDTLSGNEGADLIDGQGGADRLLETASGTMILSSDVLNTNGEEDSLRGIMSAFLFGQDGNDVIDASAFTGWVRLTGGAGNDVLTGARFSDILDGQDGDDVLSGLTGGDFLFGGNGADEIEGGAGDDDIRGGRGADVISAGDGNDLIVGEHGHDRISGGAGADRIVGGGGRDTMSGNAGDDILIGNGGRDVIAEDISGPVEVTRVGINGASTGSDRFGSIESVSLTGTDGPDYINATGFRGSLFVFAGGGDDFIIGGRGNDVLHGGAGNDRLDGLSGDDILAGQDGDDLLLGRAGDDFLVGGGGNDILDGGAGNDRLRGNGGDDSLRGGAGNDLLEGNSQSDLLLGGTGDDTLTGGKGGDTLLGEAGIDDLDGERNRDVGTGGGNGSGASALDVLVSIEDVDDAFAVDFDALIAAF
ncbi:MAG: cadherin domain-containing protein [Planctomycetota bacterium]